MKNNRKLKKQLILLPWSDLFPKETYPVRQKCRTWYYLLGIDCIMKKWALHYIIESGVSRREVELLVIVLSKCLDCIDKVFFFIIIRNNVDWWVVHKQIINIMY